MDPVTMLQSLKKPVLLIVCAISTLGFGDTVLERKVISDGKVNCSDIRSLNIFLTKDGSASVLVQENNLFLYKQNNLRTIDTKERMLLNGFVEKDHVMLAFLVFHGNHTCPDIDVYDVQKGFDKPVESIEVNEKMKHGYPDKLIAIPQTPGKYYVFYTEEKFTPTRYLMLFLSGGHAYGNMKPYLAEVEKGRISRNKEIQYGGKRDESFHVKEIINDSKMIHCLGFRNKDTPGPYIPRDSPYILYYAGYDLKEKKVTQNHNVYEINYDPGSYKFGPLSIACKDNEVFVAFSFYKYPYRGAHFDIKQITSDVYYFQYSDKTASDTVQIAEGFMPLVKVDSIGRVYVFWIDYDGNLICKIKKDDKWSDKKIVLTGIDILSPRIVCNKYISAEFDSENDLHIVFPSKGKLVYGKVKLDFTPDKQN